MDKRQEKILVEKVIRPLVKKFLKEGHEDVNKYTELMVTIDESIQKLIENEFILQEPALNKAVTKLYRDFLAVSRTAKNIIGIQKR